MPNTQTHTEKIKCPDCGTIQDATVEHTIPFHTYLHNCEKCNFTIMESDWEVVPNTEKQMTAMSTLRERLQKEVDFIRDDDDERDRYARQALRNTIKIIDELLATERGQLIDAHIAGQKFASDNDNPDSEEYYLETFKPNK